MLKKEYFLVLSKKICRSFIHLSPNSITTQLAVNVSRHKELHEHTVAIWLFPSDGRVL